MRTSSLNFATCSLPPFWRPLIAIDYRMVCVYNSKVGQASEGSFFDTTAVGHPQSSEAPKVGSGFEFAAPRSADPESQPVQPTVSQDFFTASGSATDVSATLSHPQVGRWGSCSKSMETYLKNPGPGGDHGPATSISVFPQQPNFAIWSLAQISGAIRCSFNTRFRTRFWRVLVQIPREAPEGSGADISWGSGGFCAVPEGSGADTSWGSGGFRCFSMA